MFDDFFKGVVAGRSENPYVLSGLPDLKYQLLMTEEFALSTFPRLKFLEKEPQAAGIFRDGDGNLASFSRTLEIPCSVKESERKYLWKDGQSFFEQPFYIWVSPMSLARADYYPAAGDLFMWRDTWRQVTAIKIDPSDYFGNTGFPLYIKIESSLWVPELGMDGMVPCSPETRPVQLGLWSIILPVTDVAADRITPTHLTGVTPPLPDAPFGTCCDEDRLDALTTAVDAEEQQRALTDDQIEAYAAQVDASKQDMITISLTPPPNPQQGDEWLNLTNGRRFAFYQTSWVESF